METIGNNTSAEYARVRDVFFGSEGERKNFENLMQNPNEREIHTELLKKSADKLYEMAMDLINRVECGEFNQEQMERVEREIAHYLAAIEDVQLALVKSEDALSSEDARKIMIADTTMDSVEGKENFKKVKKSAKKAEKVKKDEAEYALEMEM